jgi:hypothetical protein
MRPILFISVTLAGVIAASSSLAADEFCEQVKSFEQKPLTELSEGWFQRRWIDFSWGASDNLKENEVQIGATLKCRGSDDVAKILCRYLLRHTSHEFITTLPLDILACEGFVSGWAAFTHRWVQELSWDAPNGMIEQFQIDQLDRPDHEPSMRLTILPYPEPPEAKKPEPFFKTLSAKLGVEDQGED